MSLEHKQIVIASPQSKVKGRKLSTILLRRRLQVLGVSGAVISVASLLTLAAKPTHQSSMQILVSSKQYDEVESNHIQENAQSKLIAPHLEIVDSTAQQKLMLSSKLIQKTVDLLRTEYPNLTVEDINGKKGKTPLVITPLEQQTVGNKVISQIFEISFKDDDPIKVQKVLQALQKVYQDYHIELGKESLSRGLAFINERLPMVKDKMSQAEKNLEQFRKRHNLLDPEVQGKILLQSLAEIKKQLRTTRAQLQDLQARYNNLRQELSSSPENTINSFRLSQSSRYQTLLKEIQKTDLALTQEQLRYTNDSPAVQKLVQQRRTQEALLQEEIERSLGNKAAPVGTEILSGIEEPLLTGGQVTPVDLKVAQELIQIQTNLLGLRANEKSLANSEAQIRAELTRYPTLIAEYNRLLPEVDTNRKTLEQLMAVQQSLGLMLAQGRFDLQVLEEPQPGTNLGSSKLFILLAGLLLAPIFGVTSALISEISNDTVSSPEELQRLTNLRLLGIVPELPLLNTKKRRFRLPLQRVLTHFSSETISEENSLNIYALLPSHETLDMAYQSIQISKSSPYKSLMFTSAISGEGKSTLALGLAVSAARMHQRVLLIDASLRQPNLHKILGLTNDWGLSLLLVEETNSSVKEYIQPIHPAIDVLTAGPTPEDTAKLLSSGRMKELLEFFEQNYDVVLIDTSPLLSTVDARIVASLCEGLVMVGRMDRVTRSQLMQATEILNHLNLIGMIANGTHHSA